MPDEVLTHFEDAAKELIEAKDGAVNAVAAALAHISGSTSVKNRSLLSSLPGFTAILLNCESEIRFKGYMCVGEEDSTHHSRFSPSSPPTPSLSYIAGASSTATCLAMCALPSRA